MSKKEKLEVRLDELEQVVLRNARRSRVASSPSVEENLLAVRQRIAALPLTGLPSIQIPRVPASPSALDPIASGPTLPAGGSFQSASTGSKSAAEAGAKVGAKLLGTPAASGALPSLPTTTWLSLTSVKLAALGVGLLGVAAIAPRWIAPAALPLGSDHQAAQPNAATNPPLGRGKLSEVPSSDARTFGSTPTLQASSNPQGQRATERSTRLDNASSKDGSSATSTNAKQDLALASDSAERDFETEGERGAANRATLSEELQSLHDAQQALQAGDAQGAWQTMITLDRSSPRGALHPEREMTKVLALCALGNTNQAQTLAAQLRASSAGAMYGARLQKSCAATTTSEEPSTVPSSPAKK